MSTTEEKLAIMLEIVSTINVRVAKIENDTRLVRSKVHEFGILLKRANTENRQMLKCCQKGYYNLLQAQEYVCSKTEEMLEDTCDLSNSVSNLNWGGC